MKSRIAPPNQPAAASAQALPPTRWTVASLSLAMLLSALGTSIANVGLPTLAQAFDASFQHVQWVVLAYLLAITTSIVGVGKLADVVGRRHVMLIGILVFTAASAVCGIAPSLWLLIAARAAQGLGAAIMMVLAMAMVGEAVPKARMGSAMGLLGTMSAIGTALGPTLGGVLIAACGWPALFLVNLPLGALTLVLASRHLPRTRQAPEAGRPGFDATGTLLLALTLAAYALAMTLGRGGFGALNLALLLAALLGLGLFVRAESQAAAPLIQLTMFRNPVLSAGLAMSALVTTVVMATLVVGPFYLAGALGLDAARVGLVMSSGPIMAALTGAPAGRLVDRFGAHRMTLGGLVAMAVGSSLLPMLPTAFGVPGYAVPLMVLTAGYALFQAANNTAVMANIQPDRKGVTSGLLNLSRNLGLVTGASLMGMVFAIGTAASNLLTAPAESIVAGMRVTFAVASGLIVIALVVASAGQAFARHTAHPSSAPGGSRGAP